MRRVPLGRTRLMVTPIGLGLAAAGRPGYIDVGRDEDLGPDRSVETMKRRTHELLDAAYEVGIRYIDAARSYGRAEEFLASWFASGGDPQREVVVGSKWGYRYVGDWRFYAPVHEVKDHSVEALRRQHAESRALLGDRLALYQIHSATLETGVLRDRDVFEMLAAMRDAGLAIGLSVSGPRQSETVRAALGIEVTGRPLFGSVQATWNALERSVEPALREAAQAGLGVIVKEVLANGRLVRDERAAGPIRALADRLGLKVDAVALALASSRPWCDVVLSGAVTREQLRSNAEAVDIRLSEDDVRALDGMVEDPATYWSERSALPWR
jgi:aryl-alcohol dehydrogenase-like predicted oxidoreductase